MRDVINDHFETNEIPVNGELSYCSEKGKGGSVREHRVNGSEEIEKDAIKGDLIYVCPLCSC